MEEDVWLIWSIEHAAWWGPQERGYVPDPATAGRYSLKAARRICAGANKFITNGKPHEDDVAGFMIGIAG